MEESGFDQVWGCVFAREVVMPVALPLFLSVEAVLHFLGLVFWAGWSSGNFSSDLGLCGIVLCVTGSMMNLSHFSPIGQYLCRSWPSDTKKAITVVSVGFSYVNLITNSPLAEYLFTFICIGSVVNDWVGRSPDVERILYGYSAMLLFVSLHIVVMMGLQFRFQTWSILFLFCYSVIISNSSFALFYLPLVVGSCIRGSSVFVLVFTFVFLSYHVVKNMSNNFPDKAVIAFVFLAVIWQVSSVIYASILMSDWEIIDSFEAATTQRNWFFAGQAMVFPIIAITSMIALLVSRLSCCHRSSVTIEEGTELYQIDPDETTALNP